MGQGAMKLTTGGVLYDTDAAEVIGKFATAEPGPHACYGTLYQTPRSGRFFIYGSGGFLTRFRGKKRIIPVTEGEARLVKNTLIRRTREGRT